VIIPGSGVLPAISAMLVPKTRPAAAPAAPAAPRAAPAAKPRARAAAPVAKPALAKVNHPLSIISIF
jgi:hypothetical protein